MKNSRMQTGVLSIALALCSCSVSCVVGGESAPTSPDKSKSIVLRPTSAGFHEGARVPLELVERKIKSGEKLSGAQFIDAEHGWVFGERSLFQTSDGGTNWKPLQLKLENGAKVSSLSFIDENQGWLAANTRSLAEPYALANFSKILVTTDGGVSWLEQAAFRDGVVIEQAQFLNANEGLAIGTRAVDSKPVYDEIFVAKTTDSGRNWVDISANLKGVFKGDAEIPPSHARDVHWISSKQILLLASEFGSVFETIDGGEKWNLVARLEDQRPNGLVSSTSYYKLAVDPQQKIRIVGGAMGDEGFWSDFIVQTSPNAWTSHELPLVPLFDAVFLSETEVVACGMERPAKEGSSTVGIILHSLDAGKNWVPIYRSKSVERFMSVSRIGNRKFYAVSDAGTLLQVQLNP